MPNILGRFKFDVETWKQAIAADKLAHAEAGLRLQQVWHNADNPEEIFFLFEADDLEQARTFLDKAGALDNDCQQRGEIPTLFFLDPA